MELLGRSSGALILKLTIFYEQFAPKGALICPINFYIDNSLLMELDIVPSGPTVNKKKKI